MLLATIGRIRSALLKSVDTAGRVAGRVRTHQRVAHSGKVGMVTEHASGKEIPRVRVRLARRGKASADSDAFSVGGIDGKFGEMYHIPIGLIEPDPDQHRKFFAEDKLQELARSIKASGQKTAINVVPHPTKPDKFMIVAGERRWRASNMVGLATMRAVVEKMTTAERVEVQAIENMIRADMTPMEEAFAYKANYLEALKRLSKKQQKKGKTMLIGDAVDFVSERLGVSADTVRKYIGTANNLDENIQRLVGKKDGKGDVIVTIPVALQLAGLPKDKQVVVLNKIGKMDSEEAIRFIHGVKQHMKAEKSGTLFGKVDDGKLAGEDTYKDAEKAARYAELGKRYEAQMKLFSTLSKVTKEGDMKAFFETMMRLDDKQKTAKQRIAEIEKLTGLLEDAKKALLSVKHDEDIREVFEGKKEEPYQNPNQTSMF